MMSATNNVTQICVAGIMESALTALWTAQRACMIMVHVMTRVTQQTATGITVHAIPLHVPPAALTP